MKKIILLLLAYFPVLSQDYKVPPDVIRSLIDADPQPTISLTREGIDSPIFNNISDKAIVYESHQDHVSILPENAIKLAYNEKCIQAFQLFETMYSVQFHPEFSWEIMKKYVEIRGSSGARIDNPSVPESTQSQLVLNNFINII